MIESLFTAYRGNSLFKPCGHEPIVHPIPLTTPSYQPFSFHQPFWAAAPKGPMTYGTTQGDSESTFLRFYVSPFLHFYVSMFLRFSVPPPQAGLQAL